MNPLLTKREREVLSLLLQGKTHKEISQKLGITTSATEKHATNIYGKYGIPHDNQWRLPRLIAKFGHFELVWIPKGENS